MDSEKECKQPDEGRCWAEGEEKAENNWLFKDRNPTVFEFFCFWMKKMFEYQRID